MKTTELITALSRLKVETGSLACFVCGHEHSCSVKGCAIINEAVAALKESDDVLTAVQGDCDYCMHRYKSGEDSPCWHCKHFAVDEFITGDYWQWCCAKMRGAG